MSTLSCLNQDIYVLQKTPQKQHFTNQNGQSSAQRLWTLGPSFWSPGEDSNKGIGVLSHQKENIIIGFVLEAVPGRLLVVDFP